MAASLDSIGRHRQPLRVAPHRHPHHELIVMLRGRCQIMLAGTDHELAPGQGLLIPAGHEHDQRDQGWCDNYYLKFSGTPAALSVSPRRLDHDDELVPRWCHDLDHLLQHDDHTACDALLAVLLDLLARQEREQVRQSTLPPQLGAALHFIEEHFASDIGSADIAAAAGISCSHLNLLFRKHHGRSPGAQLLCVRMRHARRLLRDDYRSISETAAAVGMPDPNHFARRFRQEHGLAPGAWRRRQANENQRRKRR